MNYFEHHIGDYDSETAHLSWLQDMAYTRLIRLYYRKEKPITPDIKEVCRKVRANSKQERQAVEDVLNEFFTLRDDGWHQKTCDENIEAFLAGEPEREAKKANEETRLKRHREERSMLFQALTTAGQHAAWNIGIKELRELVKALPAPATPPLPATAPATPATATQTPIPNTQTPILNSAPNGAGDESPPNGLSANEALFQVAVPWLVANGCKESSIRSLLGGAIKQIGAESAWHLASECMREKPMEPTAWLAAGLNDRISALSGGRKSHAKPEKFDPVAHVNRNRIQP